MFSTATMVNPARLNVTLYVQLPVSLVKVLYCLSRNFACGQSAIREDVYNFVKLQMLILIWDRREGLIG
jgi:hypothetical protein